MPKLVVLTGVMQVLGDAPPDSPPGIWGPNDPRPTLPIAGWNPGTGMFPPWFPPQPPLGIWGPNDPRPTHPIYGFDRWTGMFPGGRPPEPPEGVKPPGMPGQLPGSDPEGSGWVFAFVPGYGWMWAYVPKNPPTDGGGEPPTGTEPPTTEPEPK